MKIGKTLRCGSCFGTGEKRIKSSRGGKVFTYMKECNRCEGSGCVFIPVSPLGERKYKDTTP